MAAKFTYSHSLRVIGQILDKIDASVFEIRNRNDYFYLQCGDPAPPHCAIIEMTYSPADIRSLDLQAKAERQKSFKFVDFDGLAEILRALGGYVESKQGQLVQISNCEGASGQDCIKLEYETSDGKTCLEEISTETLSDYAMRMYKDRARIHQERAHK